MLQNRDELDRSDGETMTEIHAPDTAYDVAFLEGAYHASGSLAGEFDEYLSPHFPDEGMRWWYEFWYPWHFYHVVDTLPDDHPWKQRLEEEWINQRKAIDLVLPPDDPELWQVIRDTLADLPLPRFADWFPSLMEHPLAESLGQQLGIERWYRLALEDPGLPKTSTFVCYDPCGSNRTRRCIPEYTYPVPLEITVEECRACLVWARTLGEHMVRALEEVGDIFRAVEDAVADLGLDPSELSVTPGLAIKIFDEIDNPWEAARVLLQKSLRIRKGIEAGTTPAPCEPIEDLLTAFHAFWSLWMAWFPRELAAQHGTLSPVIRRLLETFPPSAEDTEAWSLLADVFGDLPLARFCFWFGATVQYAFALQRAAELGILERLESARQNPGSPPESDVELPPVLRPGWQRVPATQPPPSPDETRAMFEWLEAMRQRFEDVLRFILD